jgi:hypothetical protein
MHGAWAFDLLLLIFTGGVTVMAFRQLTVEQDQNDVALVDRTRPRLDGVGQPSSAVTGGSQVPVG